MSQCFNPHCLYQNPPGLKFCMKCGTKLLLGERYRATHIIGQGGFGRTFLAVDEYKPSKPRCVIKQFLPQDLGTNNVEKAAELFQREAVRLDELGHHPQIPELLAYLTQDGRQYLVQEFIDGQNLAQELETSGCFSQALIQQLLSDLLPVLEFLHAGLVIHRDIKPENIIRRRADKKLVLVDFGAAKLATATALLKTGTIVGSPEYVAPEQTRGKPVFASDLYSLGVTCIYLLTQTSPFDLFDVNENAWVWRHYLTDDRVSDRLGSILDKLIENAIKRRYQSAAEVLQELNPPSVSATVTSAPPTSAIVQLQPVSVTLKSEVGIDYTKLRDLLYTGKWEEADAETARIMILVAGRAEKDWLNKEDIKKFPGVDLRTIDQLWVKYSNGRFGFSIQKRIYQSLDGGTSQYDLKSWEAFADKVGWRMNNEWLYRNKITFSQDSPVGHLPVWQSGVEWWLGRWLGEKFRVGWGISLFSRPDL